MASIRREFTIRARPEQVWDALRDVGNIHRRLVPGFVTDCRLEGDSRRVTFANGMQAREMIVDVDDAARRVVWSARAEWIKHHNGSLQIFAEGEGTRAVWIADLLPHELAAPVAVMIDQGVAAMIRTLERCEAA